MKKWIVAAAICTAAGLAQAAPPTAGTDSGEVNIWFARHGKTILNTLDRVQGWADSPLTAKGVEGARYLGEGLKGIKFDSFYSSDAGRQRETMAVIARQMGVKNYQDRELVGLREMYFGSFEGQRNQAMTSAAAKELGMKDSKALLDEMQQGKISMRKVIDAISASDPEKQAENFAQIKQRTQAALSTIVSEAKARGDKNVLAISSGISMQVMISDLTENSAKNIPLSNAAVVKVVYKDGKYSVPEIGNMQYVIAGKAALEKK